MSTEKIGKADRVYGKETTMEELYFTIAGCSHYFGSDFMEKGMKVKLEKEPDNEYDKEAIQVKVGKGAYAIHQSGKWYTNENIDQMLMERHLNKKARRSSHKNHIKGARKRTEDDDVRFAQSFEKLILMAKSKEGA